MLLPGRAAANVRKQAAGVLCRYLGADLSLIDELSAIHLAQQGLDEDEPARLFGQQVESDAIKRKREEVTLAELELQLCEQSGALKRRRIEGSGSSDDRDKKRCTDMIREIQFGSAAPNDQQDKEICIREIINAAGRGREVGLDCKLGKAAKKLLLADKPQYAFRVKIFFVTDNRWRRACG